MERNSLKTKCMCYFINRNMYIKNYRIQILWKHITFYYIFLSVHLFMILYNFLLHCKIIYFNCKTNFIVKKIIYHLDAFNSDLSFPTRYLYIQKPTDIFFFVYCYICKSELPFIDIPFFRSLHFYRYSFFQISISILKSIFVAKIEDCVQSSEIIGFKL